MKLNFLTKIFWKPAHSWAKCFIVLYTIIGCQERTVVYLSQKFIFYHFGKLIENVDFLKMSFPTVTFEI